MKIKPVPVLRWRLPCYLFGFSGFALRWFIIADPTYPDQRELVGHEMRHIQQQRDVGILRFLWRYWRDRTWRATYEADAFATSVSLGRSQQMCAWDLCAPSRGPMMGYPQAWRSIALALDAAAVGAPLDDLRAAVARVMKMSTDQLRAEFG